MANPAHVTALLTQTLNQMMKQMMKWSTDRGSRPEEVFAANINGATPEDFWEPNLNWNLWRSEHVKERPDLSEATLSKANLVEADLSVADLSKADLREANLRGADLRHATLRSANLQGAILRGADLSEADLSGADLRMADIRQTYLQKTILIEADLTNVSAGWTVFADIDLSVAKGLENIQHAGPSTLGIDTAYKSKGKIPEVFLRGAGVPDSFIAYIDSLVGKPIEFYSCFISYSFDDQHFAQQLYTDLQSKGVRCWLAGHDMQGGKKVHEQIDQAIRLHDKALLVLSEASMASEWVKTEIAKARKREVKESKRMLFPIRLVDFKKLQDWECFDADVGKDSAREIREYFVPDFSRWKDHDSYQEAFERLVRDLKAEGQKP